MIDEQDPAGVGIVVHVVVDDAVMRRRSGDAVAGDSSIEQTVLRPTASGSLASWIPPLPLPETVLPLTAEYELPSRSIPLPGLFGSPSPLLAQCCAQSLA